MRHAHNTAPSAEYALRMHECVCVSVSVQACSAAGMSMPSDIDEDGLHDEAVRARRTRARCDRRRGHGGRMLRLLSCVLRG